MIRYVTKQHLEEAYAAYRRANARCREVLGEGVRILDGKSEMSCWEFMNWNKWRVI